MKVLKTNLAFILDKSRIIWYIHIIKFVFLQGAEFLNSNYAIFHSFSTAKTNENQAKNEFLLL